MVKFHVPTTDDGIGLLITCVILLLQRHPRRRLGLITFGFMSWVACQSLALTDGSVSRIWLTTSTTLIAGPMILAICNADPTTSRRWKAPLLIVMIAAVAALVVLGLDHCHSSVRWSLLGMAVAGALLSSWILFAPTLELVLEWVFFPLYRIRAHGPGRQAIPRHGPLLLIANHSSYLDPFWLGKIIPRQFTPMMTSTFYDLPVVRWFMRRVVKAIRVQASGFRREAPELKEALDVLKNGGCLLLFPEAILRRTEDQLLRQFGQGVWHLLSELPDTPVVVFWIEGGWGSFLSYKDGPPTKNKRPDFWHRIDVAAHPQETLSREVLADHRTTRAYLMRRCLESRSFLGLDVPEDNQANESEG